MMGVINQAIGDAILTSLWVFSISSLRILSSKLSISLGLEPFSLSGLFITSILNTLIIFTISLISRSLLGGASFNPSSTITFYTAGLRPDSSISTMALRFPAQALGGAVGAKSLLFVMPSQYKNMLKGPILKVGLHSGAIAEGVFTFTLNLSVLVIVMKGPKNPFLKMYLIAVTTLCLVIPGSGFTGPAMNPANAFGWAYVHNRHNNWEHFYVYWIGPFIGAIFAALVYKFLFLSQVKQKKA